MKRQLLMILVLALFIFNGCGQNTSTYKKHYDEVKNENNLQWDKEILNKINEVKKKKKEYIEINEIMKADWSNMGCHFMVHDVNLSEENSNIKSFVCGPCGVYSYTDRRKELYKNGDEFVGLINQKAKNDMKMKGYYKYEGEEESVYCELVFDDGTILIWDNGDLVTR